MSTTFNAATTATTHARPTQGAGIVTSTSRGLLGPVFAALCALPSNNTVTAEFAITPASDRSERWERTFGSRHRSTLIRWTSAGFVERIGVLRLTFDADANGHYNCSRMHVGPLVIPRLVTISVVVAPGRTAVDIAVGNGGLGSFSYAAMIGAAQ